MPKPPIDPDSFDKINFVIDAWTTGCDAPWYIYVETMKPALLTAFITLITFGWDDVLRGFLRPRGLYKRRTAKRKGKWARRLPRFPEIGNSLGTHLPGATEVKGAKWSSLGKTLWRIDGVMEQIKFFWLVASIVEDFAFDWTSLLYESYWCLPDAGGNFSFTTFGVTPFPGNRWYIVFYPTEDYENGPPNWNVSDGHTGVNGATIAAALNFGPRPGGGTPTSYAVRVVDDADGRVIFQSDRADATDTGTGVGVTVGNVPPNTTFRVEAWTDAGSAYYQDGVILGHETLR